MYGPPDAGGWTLLVPLVIIGLVILRNARGRRVRIETLWIAPLLLLVMAGLAISQAPPSNALAGGVVAIALVLGSLLGWYRGRASRFTIDPETHVVTSRVSPLGMLLLLSVFALRYLLRAFADVEASILHVTPSDIADAFLMLAVGVVCAGRLEWWIRARAMIAAARRG